MKMQFLVKTAIAAALSAFALGASAMTPMQDDSLSQVSGQDGVSIAANLNVNVGEFKYTDTDATGGSVSFYNIKTTGLIAATLDVINAATFNGILASVGVSNLGAFYNGTSDVVQIAIPNVTLASPAVLLSQSIDAIRMGNGYDGNPASATTGVIAANANPSFGSLAMNQIDLRGTTAWIWAH